MVPILHFVLVFQERFSRTRKNYSDFNRKYNCFLEEFNLESFSRFWFGKLSRVENHIGFWILFPGSFFLSQLEKKSKFKIKFDSGCVFRVRFPAFDLENLSILKTNLKLFSMKMFRFENSPKTRISEKIFEKKELRKLIFEF